MYVLELVSQPEEDELRWGNEKNNEVEKKSSVFRSLEEKAFTAAQVLKFIRDSGLLCGD